MTIERKLEETLFKLIKSGDETAFEMLFKLYYTDMCGYAVTFVKIPEIAEEIVQESFINIWEKRDKINIEVSWKAYIYRTVHNRCINHLKKSRVLTKQDQAVKDAIIYHHQIVSQYFDPNVLDMIMSEELAKSIQEALDNLPDQCHTVFLMSREDRRSYSEIAEKLNISVNTVKAHMKKALRKLREALEKHK